ncbi:MAG: amidohydrolase family protein [Candidatus Bathyarchaeia archaeon]
MRIIDGHIHVGSNRLTKYYTLDEVWKELHTAEADGACIFAFPEDMYRSVNVAEARVKANKYVLEVSKTSRDFYPFYFVWNDYLLPDNLEAYRGIKWHRHADEPKYDYDDPKCFEILNSIKELRLPVLLEEEFENTVLFIKQNPALTVIIPHVGGANGGTKRMEVFFDNPNIYFDTAVAPLESIKYILRKVGPERIIFGSDVSGTKMPFFNFPIVERDKLRKLDLDDECMQLIFAGNIERLVKA